MGNNNGKSKNQLVHGGDITKAKKHEKISLKHNKTPFNAEHALGAAVLTGALATGAYYMTEKQRKLHEKELNTERVKEILAKNDQKKKERLEEEEAFQAEQRERARKRTEEELKTKRDVEKIREETIAKKAVWEAEREKSETEFRAKSAQWTAERKTRKNIEAEASRMADAARAAREAQTARAVQEETAQAAAAEAAAIKKAAELASLEAQIKKYTEEATEHKEARLKTQTEIQQIQQALKRREEARSVPVEEAQKQRFPMQTPPASAQTGFVEVSQTGNWQQPAAMGQGAWGQQPTTGQGGEAVVSLWGATQTGLLLPPAPMGQGGRRQPTGQPSAPPVALPQRVAPSWNTILKSWYKEPTVFLTDLASKVVQEPETVILPPSGKVIAFGDVHADIDALLLTLFYANVINEQADWIGENAIVLQLGDQIDGKRSSEVVPASSDRCPELEVIQYSEFLNSRARQAGGRYVTLLGNHEINSTPIENWWFHTQYASQRDRECINPRTDYFAPGTGLVATKILAARPVIVRCGSFVFSHADIAANVIGTEFEYEGSFIDVNNVKKWGVLNFSFEEINNMTFNYLRDNKLEVTKDSKKINVLDVINTDRSGVLWRRKYCDPKDTYYSNTLPRSNYTFIAGHSIGDNVRQINARVWCVDTGRSSAFSNPSLNARDVYKYRLSRAQSLQITNIFDHPQITILRPPN